MTHFSSNKAEEVSNNNFKLIVLGIIATCLIIGGVCFTNYSVTKVKKETELQKVEIIQDAKNKRNEERWASLPFLRNNKKKDK